MKPEAGSLLKNPAKSTGSFFQRWLPVIVQVWLTGVLVFFIAIRILNSNTAQHFFASPIFHKWGGH